MTTKRERGRPKRIVYEVKPLVPEIVECILCKHEYDINTILLEQRMINDTNFCKNCFNEFLNAEEYEIDNVKSFW